MAGYSQTSAPQSGPSGSQQFGSQGTQAGQPSQQAPAGGQQGGSKRTIGAPILIVGILVLLYLMFFGSGCAPAGSNQGADAEQTVSIADLTASADEAPGEVPGMQRGLFDILFGFDSSGGYSNTYDSSQYTSAYQIDPNLGQGNPNETWTVLMYLCGSDLESTPTQRGGGQATKNLVELTKANLGQNVKFVVEAGGAKAWHPDFTDTCIEDVRARLPHPEKAHFVKGYFPESASQLSGDDMYLFVNIDPDLYEPTKQGLEYFWPRLVQGGVIMVHDYNSMQFQGVKKAVWEFADQNGLMPVPLADLHGTAVFVKQK